MYAFLIEYTRSGVIFLDSMHMALYTSDPVALAWLEQFSSSDHALDSGRALMDVLNLNSATFQVVCYPCPKAIHWSWTICKANTLAPLVDSKTMTFPEDQESHFKSSWGARKSGLDYMVEFGLLTKEFIVFTHEHEIPEVDTSETPVLWSLRRKMIDAEGDIYLDEKLEDSFDKSLLVKKAAELIATEVLTGTYYVAQSSLDSKLSVY